MILLISNERDLTTDFVILELQRRGRAFFRLNSERLPEAQVTLGLAHVDDWSIELDDRRVCGTDIGAAYFRRPGRPEPSDVVKDLGTRAYCETEWNAFLKSLYGRLEGRWLNSPMAIVLAEDKPRQLLLARELGFDVPETRITNDAQVASRLSSQQELVGKPLHEALLHGPNERVMFTARLGEISVADQTALSFAPVILQAEIRKETDLRVTVVGDRVFAVAIHSQVDQETEVDWRRGAKPDLKHERVTLPATLASKCIRLTKALGLAFGAIDLVLDRTGRYWFLEINPNGQWAWIENRTGLPLAAAIVDVLDQIAAR